jgi:hypothetical protein
MPVRIPVVAVVAAVGLTLGLVGVSLLTGRADRSPLSRPASSAVSSAASPPESFHGPAGALGVLADWDRRRAAVWAAGDAGALRRLYTRGSSAGVTDVALLEAYAARGLVVRGLRMQLLRARVLVARPRRLELEVTDRLFAATAAPLADATASWRLPVGAATTRVLVLRRIGDRWLMARVSSARS